MAIELIKFLLRFTMGDGLSPKYRAFSLLRTLTSTAARAGLETVSKKVTGSKSADDASISAAAMRLVKGLDELKGAAMKVGQLLSMHHDDELLPPGWKAALSKLRSGATPWSWDRIEPLLRAGVPHWNFREIDKEAVHAASIGQVHRAVLNDGRHVAVKVRYPDLEKNLHSDLNNLKKTLKLFNYLPSGKSYEALFSTVESVFLQELDFERERFYYEEYKRLLEPYPQYAVPEVIGECCSETVLTTTWLEGQQLWQFAKQAAEDFSLQECADEMGHHLIELILIEIFVFHRIQTDPNPANFIVMADGRLGLLDFGATMELKSEFVAIYGRLIQSLLADDFLNIVKCCIDLNILCSDDSKEIKETFVRMLRVAMVPCSQANYSWRGQRLANLVKEDSLKFAAATRFRPPPSEMVFFNRRVLGTELLLEELGPRVNFRELMLRYLPVY